MRRDGAVLVSTAPHREPLPAESGFFRASDGRTYQVAASRVGGFDIAVALPTAPVDELRRPLYRVMAVALVVALLLGVLLARTLAARAVAPLLTVAEAAERIDLASLGSRLAPP